MSAIDDLKSVFTSNTNEQNRRSFSTPRDGRKSGTAAQISTPIYAPNSDAERQWLDSVIMPGSVSMTDFYNQRHSADTIPLLPQTPKQVASQKRMEIMQQDVQEIIGMMRMNFDKCVLPDKRLSELYNLGPGYNPHWECQRQSEYQSSFRWDRLRPYCVVLGVIIVCLLLFVGDYFATRWTIAHEMELEIVEKALYKQQKEEQRLLELQKTTPIPTTTTTTRKTSPTKQLPTPRPAPVPPIAIAPIASKSGTLGELQLATEKPRPVPVPPKVPIASVSVTSGDLQTATENPGELELAPENSGESQLATEKTGDLQLATEIPSMFPRAHDVLDPATVGGDTADMSHNNAIQDDSFWRPQDDRDVEEEKEYEANNGPSGVKGDAFIESNYY